jgi:hypothetical protein
MSADLRHTPGTWQLERSQGAGGDERWEVNANGPHRVCVLSRVNGRANGKLIAAAPDLATAMTHQILRNHDFSENCGGCNAALAALTKAGLR